MRKRMSSFRIIGLTGSIGMGKSTTADMLRACGVPVFDADAQVHVLFQPGGAAVARVLARFPGVDTESGGIDRQKLGGRVIGHQDELAALEAIVHPLVSRAREQFFRRYQQRRMPAVAVDVPLLFEADGWTGVSEIWVVSAPRWLQSQRVLARPGMSKDRFTGILARQVPDPVKRCLADVIVPTGLGRRSAMIRVKKALHRKSVKSRHARYRSASIRRWRKTLEG